MRGGSEGKMVTDGGQRFVVADSGRTSRMVSEEEEESNGWPCEAVWVGMG